MENYNQSGRDRQKRLEGAADRTYSTNGASGSTDHMPGENASMDFSAIWRAVGRGKWIILITTVLFVGVAVVYNHFAERIYRASSIVAVQVRESASAGPGVETGSRTLASEVGVLENSADLARRVVQRMEEAANAMGTRQHYPILVSEADTSGGQLSTHEKAERLRQRVNFYPYSSQNMIGIAAQSESPEEVATIANFYAEEYEEFSRERARESIAASRQFLEDQVQKREQELQQYEDRLTAFARQEEIPKHGQGGTQVIAQYRSLRQSRDEAAFELKQERSNLQLLERQLEQAEPDLEEQVTQEQSVKTLQSRIDAINESLGALEAEAEVYYMNYPNARDGDVDTVSAELAELERRMQHLSARKETLTAQLAAAMRNASGSVGRESSVGYIATLRSRITETEQNIQRLEAKVAALTESVDSYESQLQEIPQQQVEREQLERKIAQAEQWYNSIVSQLQKVRVMEEAEQGYVNVVRSALVPNEPVEPNVQQNIILAILLGLGFGTGLAFVRRAGYNRVERPEDLVMRGYRLMGVIPVLDDETIASRGTDMIDGAGYKRSRSLVTLTDPWSPASENFRLIRTNIQHAQSDGQVRTLLVTSPEVGDGKSMAAVNIAVAMAQNGHHTLLVDADLRRSTDHKLLGVERSPGLAQILTGETAFRSEEFVTSIENLAFVPAGETNRHPAELLDSKAMDEFLNSARPLYDAIVVDSPPVLSAADAVALATKCDAVVLVTAAEKTNFQALQRAQDKLRAVNARTVGTIVNRFDPSRANNRYDYGYYGKYSAQEET